MLSSSVTYQHVQTHIRYTHVHASFFDLKAGKVGIRGVPSVAGPTQLQLLLAKHSGL